jgi:hypothetical protein
MRVAYADPPYPGQSAKHYGNHPDYAGEVDHAALAAQLAGFDGYIFHTSSSALASVIGLFPGARVMSWVKPFAAFKRNVPVGYAWEPCLVVPARKPVVGGTAHPLRDYLAEPITMRRGLAGAKPERVCWWLFECAGLLPGDELVDLFPGSGAVMRAWKAWPEALKRARSGLALAGSSVSQEPLFAPAAPPGEPTHSEGP